MSAGGMEGAAVGPWGALWGAQGQMVSCSGESQVKVCHEEREGKLLCTGEENNRFQDKGMNV